VDLIQGRDVGDAAVVDDQGAEDGAIARRQGGDAA